MRVLYVATDLRDADILRQEVRRVEPGLTLDICAGLSELRARPDQPSNYDVLLMDCGLAEPEQLQLIHYVRVRQLGMPVVALSQTNGPVPTAALSAGVDDYLVRGPKFADRLGPALRLSADRYRTVSNTLREFEKVKRSEARLRLIIEALPTGVVLLDQTGKVLAMNMAGVQHFSISSPTDIVGRSFTTLMPMEDQPAMQEFLAKAIGGEEASVQFASTRDEEGKAFNLRGLCIQKDAAAGQSSVLGVLERVNGNASLMPAWNHEFDLDVSALTSSSSLPPAPLDDHLNEELQARVRELEARGQGADKRIGELEAELLRVRGSLEQAQVRESAGAEQLKRAHDEASQLVVESGSLRQALWNEQEQRTAAEEAARKAEAHARGIEEQVRQAEERVREQEGLVRTAAERTQTLEEQTRALEVQTGTLNEQARMAQEQSRLADERARAAEEQARRAEEHLRDQLRESEQQRQAVEEQRRAIEEQGRSLEEQKRILGEQRLTSEAHVRSVEEQRHAAEEGMRIVDEQRRVAEDQARVMDERRRHAEEEAHNAHQRAQQAEEAMQKAHDQMRVNEEQTSLAREQLRTMEEELRQARDHQRAAEERAAQAGDHHRGAEEQLRQAHERASGFEQQLQQTHEQLRAAEERAAQAGDHHRGIEDQLRQAHERAQGLEGELHQAREQVRAAEERAGQAGDHHRGVEDQLRQAHERAQGLESELHQAREQVRAAEERAAQAGDHHRGVEDQLRQAHERVQGLEGQLHQAHEQQRSAEEQMRQAYEQMRAAEEHAAHAADQQRVAEEQLRQAQAEGQELDGQLLQTREQVRAAEEHARQLEARVQSAEEQARLAAEAQHGDALAAVITELQQARAELAASSESLEQQRAANEQLQQAIGRKDAQVAELELRAQTRISAIEQEHRVAVERLQELLEQAMKDSTASSPSPASGGPLARTGSSGVSQVDATKRGYERVGRLATAMSDDLLAAIQTARDTARAVLEVLPAGSEGHNQALKTIEAVEKCNELARHLFRLSSRHASQTSRVDLTQLVRHQEALLHHLAGPDIELQFDLALGLSSTELDAQDVTQVLTSLIVAARDALPLGGVIRVGTAYQHRAHDTNPDAARAAERPRPLMLGVTAKGYGIRPVSSATCEEVTSRCGGTLTTVIEPNVSWTLIAMLPGGVADPVETHDTQSHHSDLTRTA
jgi:PAS domain-containing protein